MSGSKRPTPAAAVGSQVLVGLLVIALTRVIAVKVSAVPTEVSQKIAEPMDKEAKVDVATVAAAPVEQIKEAVQLAPASPLEPRKDLPVESKSGVVGTSEEPDARSEAVAVGGSSSVADGGDAKADNSADAASKRKGRAEPSAAEIAPAPVAAEASKQASGEAKPSEKVASAPADEKGRAEPSAAEIAPVPAAALAQTAEKVTDNKQAKQAPKPAKSQLAGKSGQKSKLPANLGTVTSTGSGGATHYMSKHDAYSAIAEKHGALAQDAMRKSDKRSGHVHGLGSIQKAGGFGDVLGSPFKGVSDSGLARTLGASMRSIIKNKYSVPAYVASALLGAVALMAFYESPVSPLPVPPLPEPPVGRFPPEMPNIPPNVQVPYRGNSQQQYMPNYNQRSLNTAQAGATMMSPQAGQQQQQVLFPGNNAAAGLPAQQRQMGASNGAVQQLAANLLGSVAKPQAAQRKSGIDHDYSPSSRSFFGGSPATSQKVSTGPTVNQQKQQQSNSFLSFFGFGSSFGASGEQGQQQQHAAGVTNLNLVQAAMSPLAASIEPKGGQSGGSSSSGGGLSNLHLVNKVKSYFSRSPSFSSSVSSSSSSSSSSTNPYDQYQRMSFVQALMKDTAFLPAFLSPARKSSSSVAISGANKLQNGLTMSGALSPSQAPQIPASRIGSADMASLTSGGQQMAAAGKQQQQQQKPTSGLSYGFMNRIVHALLETFTSGGGVAQRNSISPSGGQHGADRKASISSDDHQSPLASATSLLTDIMNTYGANVMSGAEQSHSEQAKALPASQQQQQVQTATSDASQQPASGRSAEEPTIIIAEDANIQLNEQPPTKQQQQGAANLVVVANKQQSAARTSPQPQSSNVVAGQQQQANEASSSAANGALLRKTRSVGLEYLIESNQELIQKQQEQYPSKAAQINNVIDFVADSYSQNKLLFNFVMNQVGLSQAVPYVEQILASGNNEYH